MPIKLTKVVKAAMAKTAQAPAVLAQEPTAPAHVEPVEEPQTLVEDQEVDGIAQIIDEYCDLKDKADALMSNPIFVQLAEAEKLMRHAVESKFKFPTDCGDVHGNHWILTVGPAAKNNRKLKEDAIPKLQAILGLGTFMKLAKVNIGDIEKYCTPDQAEQVIDSDTGYSKTRKITPKFKG